MTQLAVLPKRLDSTEIDLVKKTIANGATDEELKLFLHDCFRQGVHPLDKLIHFSKRGGKYTPITSIDFMRMRAADTGELAGSDEATYTFKDGETVIPQTATVTVYRITQGQRYAYTATARWAEYVPAKGQDFMWLKMPQLMLGKCAEALALRKAFPKQLHGIYERAEMMQAGAEGGEVAPQPVAAKIVSATMETPGEVLVPPQEEQAPFVYEAPDETVEREAALNEIRKLYTTILNTKKTDKERDQWQKDRQAAWTTYLGAATPQNADVAALGDLKKWYQARLPK